MPKFRQCAAFNLRSETFDGLLAKLDSGRKVVPVVTRTGALVRGNFPSRKAIGIAKFQSLNERNALRLFEVAPTVSKFKTHPLVLRLPGLKDLHYTPDLAMYRADKAFLVEVKSAYFLGQQETKERFQKITHRLNEHGVGLLFVLDEDIPEQLAKTVEELLHARPVIGRARKGKDVNRFDPSLDEMDESNTNPKWTHAQVECDELLARLMNRGPDQLIA
ncbi:MAG: hypothetical protein CFE43_21200 [Burkholderiales bacterium PBB3]|nr:MAG: hypothetical protein CFE43_21200 [Burkholderiales bacterium PBB3]